MVDYIVLQAANIVLTGILTAATGYCIKFLKREAKGYKAIKETQRALLKDRIVQTHDYFCEKESIGKYSLETVEDLFKQYQNLGGNSFVLGMVDEIRELPIK